jgi:signal transduction histidine kinase
MLNLVSRRLGIKFFLGMMVLNVSIIGGMLYVAYSQEKRLILQEVEKRAQDLTTILRFSAAPFILSKDYVALQRIIDSIKNRPDFRQVMMLDLAGKVLAHSNASECDKILADSLTRRILLSDTPVFSEAYAWQGEEILDVAVPVYTGFEQKAGFARAMVSLKSADAAIGAMTSRIYFLGAAGVLVAFLLAAFFSRIVTEPLRQLHQKARRIGRGEREVRIDVTSRDEIGTLQQALRTMIDELRFRSSLAALGATMAHLSHELRTPLQGITKYFDDGKELQAERRDKVLGELNRLNDLVKQLLLFSHKNKLQPSRTDANLLIEQALFLFDTLIREHRIQVDYKPVQLPAITADKNLLQSVFMNLVGNAIEAMEKDGVLKIQARLLKAPLPAGALSQNGNGWPQKIGIQTFAPEKDAIVVEIADNGIGIPEDKLDQLFLPFFTTKKTGTGLGLALSHKIILEHYGSIQVQSKIGHGTIFTILLPV